MKIDKQKYLIKSLKNVISRRGMDKKTFDICKFEIDAALQMMKTDVENWYRLEKEARLNEGRDMEQMVWLEGKIKETFKKQIHGKNN